MHRLTTLAILTLLVTALGCGGGSDDTASSTPQPDGSAATAGSPKVGTVLESMDAGTYTYVHVQAGDEQIWAAAPRCEIAVGDEVTIDTRMPMREFHSETLDRTFDLVYFTGGFTGETQAASGHGGGMGGGMSGGMPSGMASSHTKPEPAADIDLTGIERAPGGKTVAEVWAERQALAGNQVVVRGKVIKYLSGIMGKNWIHLRDGTGDQDTNDLTVTTQAFANVGDLITVKGTVAADRDFGSGYRYGVIVEDAEVEKE